MQWLELSVTAPPEYVEPLVEMFRRYSGQQVVVEESGGFNPDEGETPLPEAPVLVKTYLPWDRKAHQIKGQIDIGVRLISALAPLSGLQERVLREEDWANAWKRHFRVLHIGRWLVVVPTWLKYTPQPQEVVIHLDPGLAFGTGHHPTTRLCLKALEDLVRPGMHVLDLGTGSGILAMAAVKLGAHRVVALEIDPVAVKAARSNLRANALGRRVALRHGTLPHLDAPASAFDLAVANISAKVVLEQAQRLLHTLRSGGLLLVSGMIADREAEVADCLEGLGARFRYQSADGEWSILLFQAGDADQGPALDV